MRLPPAVKGKPIVVRAVLPIEQMSQDEIDVAVAQRMREGLSLYQVDEELLGKLDPDLILTQDLCQVCAPSGNEVAQLLQLLPRKPQILWLRPDRWRRSLRTCASWARQRNAYRKPKN